MRMLQKLIVLWMSYSSFLSFNSFLASTTEIAQQCPQQRYSITDLVGLTWSQSERMVN